MRVEQLAQERRKLVGQLGRRLAELIEQAVDVTLGHSCLVRPRPSHRTYCSSVVPAPWHMIDNDRGTHVRDGRARIDPILGPPVSVGTAVRLTMQHCLHLGIRVDDVAAILEGASGERAAARGGRTPTTRCRSANTSGGRGREARPVGAARSRPVPDQSGSRSARQLVPVRGVPALVVRPVRVAAGGACTRRRLAGGGGRTAAPARRAGPGVPGTPTRTPEWCSQGRHCEPPHAGP